MTHVAAGRVVYIHCVCRACGDTPAYAVVLCVVIHYYTVYIRTLLVASFPGFSLLPRNSLRMTFDPPERKAEGEPGPFSHVIATRIYVR